MAGRLPPGLRVVALDRPGYGASRQGAGGFDYNARAVIAELDARGIERAVCVPKTSSTSCDQSIFVDQTTDATLFPDAVLVEVGWFG